MPFVPNSATSRLISWLLRRSSAKFSKICRRGLAAVGKTDTTELHCGCSWLRAELHRCNSALGDRASTRYT
jgi:hypothetical protein